MMEREAHQELRLAADANCRSMIRDGRLHVPPWMQEATVQQKSGLPIGASSARLSEQDRAIPSKEKIGQRGSDRMF